MLSRIHLVETAEAMIGAMCGAAASTARPPIGGAR